MRGQSTLENTATCLAQIALDVVATFCRGPQSGTVRQHAVGGYGITVDGYHADCGSVHPMSLVRARAFALEIQDGTETGWVLVSARDYTRYPTGSHFPARWD